MIDLFYRLLVRPLLFLLPAEPAHHLGLRSLRFLCALPGLGTLLRRLLRPRDPALEVEVLGSRWPSPVGLAAGLDKDGAAASALANLGFGAIEVGTVTALAQPGNPKPRLFRLRADRAIINRFGFNNPGCEVMAQTLASQRLGAVPLGVNLGKSKVTPAAEAAADYVRSVRALGQRADYLVVNVSSPNTPGLRDLQAVAQLRPILSAVQEAIAAGCPGTPLALKIAPDLADEDLLAIAALAVELELDALIATNTTIERGGLTTPSDQVEQLGAGGLSGAPLRARSFEVLRFLAVALHGRVPLIAVGGVDSGEEAYRRLRIGASAVQLYSAFVFEGPGLPARINAELSVLLRRDGFTSVGQAVGVDLEEAER